MSVYQSITEKIEINNCNERTSEIIKFVKEQILHFINLDSVKYAGIDELKLSLDGSNYCVANLRADREHDHKIDIPEDLMQMIERLPKSRKMSLWWSYNLSWYASGDKDEVVEYTTDPELIYEKYQDKVDIVIDGGFGGIEGSTVVDCTSDEPEIIRQGKGELIL